MTHTIHRRNVHTIKHAHYTAFPLTRLQKSYSHTHIPHKDREIKRKADKKRDNNRKKKCERERERQRNPKSSPGGEEAANAGF